MLTLTVELGVNQRHYYTYKIPLHTVPADLRPDLDNGFVDAATEQRLMDWLWDRHPDMVDSNPDLDADEILEWEIHDATTNR